VPEEHALRITLAITATPLNEPRNGGTVVQVVTRVFEGLEIGFA
jgi:hypothetical protein